MLVLSSYIIIILIFNYGDLLFLFVCHIVFKTPIVNVWMNTTFMCMFAVRKMMCILLPAFDGPDTKLASNLAHVRWDWTTKTTPNDDNATVFWIRALIRLLCTVYPVYFVSTFISIYAASKSNRRIIASACPWQRMLVTPASCQPYDALRTITQSYTMVRRQHKVL